MSIPVPQKPNSTSLFVGRKDALDKFRKISIHSADSESRSTNVSWSSRTTSLHNLLYSSILSETSTLRRFSTPIPITGVSSGQLGFDRTSLHYDSEQIFTTRIESVARRTSYYPTSSSHFHHINIPPVDHQRSRTQWGLCDPPKTFLTPSIFRCAPTSPPMNSIRFLTWKIKSGRLVPIGSATVDS